MKKLLFALSAAVLLGGCNMGIFDFKYSFDFAEVRHLDGTCESVKVKKWWNYEDGDMVQIETADGRVILGHCCNITLFKGRIR